VRWQRLSRLLVRQGIPLLLLLCLLGCGPGRSPSRNSAKKNEVQEDVPRELVSRGISLIWQEEQPKNRIQRILEMKAETGSLNAETQSGRMLKATGIFYRDDTPRARFEAPKVEAIRQESKLIATGGVIIYSLKPKGITVRADQVVWNYAANRIVALGNVRFEQKPPGIDAPVSQGGPFPQVTIDTQVQRLTIP
jgi:hypothetical protein